MKNIIKNTLFLTLVLLPFRSYGQNDVKEITRIVVGGGGHFNTIREGFDYAVVNGIDEVYIEPGVYDLVSEGIEDYYLSLYNNPNLKQGYYAPKKVYGYGAILKCELPSPNWEISPINLYYGSNGTEIYGLTIICSNCRYCIHDKMWDMTSWGSNYYHNVFKDLTLIHKSAPSDEWVHRKHPTPILVV